MDTNLFDEIGIQSLSRALISSSMANRKDREAVERMRRSGITPKDLEYEKTVGYNNGWNAGVGMSVCYGCAALALYKFHRLSAPDIEHFLERVKELEDEEISAHDIIECTIAEAGVDERWDGTIRGEHGERYLATVRRVSNYRFIRTVVMLQDEQSADTQRAGQRWRYAAIAILVFILIAYLCWLFTGKMIQPIKEAHEQQNQFVSAASHDLRTPLQVIRVNAEALKLNPPDRDRFIDRILKELTHVSNLSEDLLTLTTAPDDSTAQGNPVEISDLVNNAVDYYKGAAVQKGISLSSRLPAEALPLIEGNEAMLQKALNILVDNAVCYTPAGGHITVEASLQSRNVIIAVRDDGPGVASEHQSRIFDRFYRADKNRTDRAHSGLGLSIAKKVIDDHGGELKYETAKPHGSVFSVALPCLYLQRAYEG